MPDPSSLDILRRPFQTAALLELYPRLAGRLGVLADEVDVDLDAGAVRSMALGPLLHVPDATPAPGHNAIPVYFDFDAETGEPVAVIPEAPLPRAWRRRLLPPAWYRPFRSARVEVTGGRIRFETAELYRPFTPATVTLACAAAGLDPVAVAYGFDLPTGYEPPQGEDARRLVRLVLADAHRYERGPATAPHVRGALVAVALVGLVRNAPRSTPELTRALLAAYASGRRAERNGGAADSLTRDDLDALTATASVLDSLGLRPDPDLPSTITPGEAVSVEATPGAPFEDAANAAFTSYTVHLGDAETEPPDHA